jgi:hypothetical protein
MPDMAAALVYIRGPGRREVRRGPDELKLALIQATPLQRRSAKGEDQAAMARITPFGG